MSQPRIALVHAMQLAVEPVVDAFRQLWPAARVMNVLDDSLPPDLAAAGSVTPDIIGRFVTLARYSAAAGADAVLFTCSAFGTAIDAAKSEVSIPVLKPNEAMLEDALAVGSRVALLATFEPSIPSLKSELEQLALTRGISLDIRTRSVPAAIAALQQGRAAEHDLLIAVAAAELGTCDALVLGQFSMARAAQGIPTAPGRQVFTSPHSAVNRLKQILDAR